MKKLCEYAVFGSHRSTLKEDSIDNSEPGHICYMTESERETINFDGVKTEYLNQRGLSEENAKSVDSLLEKDGILYMIEFKNRNMKSEKSRVKIKIRDSLLIFCDIVKENISFTRENMDFILVYNEEKNPKRSKTEITRILSEKAGEPYCLFELDRFSNLYFRKAHTWTQKEFEELFQP